MTFLELREQMLSHYELLLTTCKTAFCTDATAEELWNTYLESFPERINPIYRKRREYDCACCRNFIRQMGGIVMIDDLLCVHTLWEFHVDDPDFQVVLDAMDACVRAHSISDIFLTDSRVVGVKQNYSQLEDGTVETNDHLYLPIPQEFRCGIDTQGSKKGEYRTSVEVFERSLAEISQSAVEIVLDLINDNNLYKGTEWKGLLEAFKAHQAAYDPLPEEKKKLYVWAKAKQAGPALARIKNEAIGQLLTDITNDVNLNVAVGRYERMVAPANYMHSNSVVTTKMIREAEKKITELGYLDSLPRRFAKLDDITVNNILFSNRDAAKRIRGSVFDDMIASASVPAIKFDRVEEIPIERFIKNVLPNAREIEAYVENRHEAKLVSLIAPVNAQAPTMFKWNNAFSWAYAGNTTDSGIRENVKNAGGNIHGVLRFSIQWNDGEYSGNDLDAHCREPDRNEIFFGRKRSERTRGELDVDIIHPIKGTPAVENIVWTRKDFMIPGEYGFYVHQYANRGGRDGFRAEIEFDGNVRQYDYRRELRQDEIVEVAVVTMHKDGTFTIKDCLSTDQPREIWGIQTLQFTPVTVVMYSPNYWDEQTGIGNRHYMFMLKGCVNPEKPNGFYPEFLQHKLYENRKVLEVLGGRMAVQDTEDQLSGLGFSSTLHNSLIVKVRSSTERIMKIIF